MILHDARADAAGDLVAAAGSSVINWVSARAVAGPRARTVWCTNSDLELALSLVEATAPTRSLIDPLAVSNLRRNLGRIVHTVAIDNGRSPICPLVQRKGRPR